MPESPRTEPLTLVVLSAGTSVPSSTRMLADRLSTATRLALRERGHEVEVVTLELRELAHEVVDATLAGFPGDRLREALDVLARADGVVAVSPTYNQSYSGLFKSFVDVVRPGTLTGVPVALGATGGTARHSLAIDYALRPLFAYLKADVVPTTVFAASEDFGAQSSGPDTTSDPTSLDARAARVGTELAEYMLRFAGVTAGAVAPTRASGSEAVDEPSGSAAPRGRVTEEEGYSDFVPMSELLGR